MAWSRSKIRLVRKKDGVREPSLQALLRELAAFNTGVCVVTTRLPVADLADHAGTAALRLDLEQLSSSAGAKLLRALVCGTNGSVALFPQHRQADCTNADCEPNILTSPRRE